MRTPLPLLLPLLTALLAGPTACAEPAPHQPTVYLPGAKGEIAVTVEVARTTEERRRGLMFREKLAADHGMLFVFAEEQVQSFWMRNTKISLDLLFIAQSGRIVGIIRKAEPMNESSLSVPTPAMYVIEVNAGFADEHGVKPGGTARIKGLKAGR